MFLILDEGTQLLCLLLMPFSSITTVASLEVQVNSALVITCKHPAHTQSIDGLFLYCEISVIVRSNLDFCMLRYKEEVWASSWIKKWVRGRFSDFLFWARGKISLTQICVLFLLSEASYVGPTISVCVSVAHELMSFYFGFVFKNSTAPLF